MICPKWNDLPQAGLNAKTLPQFKASDCISTYGISTVLFTNGIARWNLRGRHAGTLFGCGPVVAVRTGNNKHFMETLFELWARSRLWFPDTRRPRQQVPMGWRASIHQVGLTAGSRGGLHRSFDFTEGVRSYVIDLLKDSITTVQLHKQTPPRLALETFSSNSF